ncbi:MAG: CoB--CoM heterodisulfide reductase iron-sulfur subunit A family protein [Terriglobales bacterium]
MSKQDVQPRGESEPVRIGVYVCRCGGNISDVVDTDAVVAAVKGIDGVAVAKVHTFVCSDPGQTTIAEDIQQERLNRVVVASCSPFLHELTFRTAVQRGGLNPYLYEHVNIREQDSWVHKHDPAGATAKALRMIAAAVGKLRHAEPLERIRITNHRQALVIGGGIAGLKAAAELAGKGIPVILVEQSPNLGGRVASLARTFPREADGADLVKNLAAQVIGHPLVRVITQARVAAISGFIGNFDVRIAADSKTDAAEDVCASVGTIIIATGFDPYTPAKGEYGFADQPAVVALPEFLRYLADLPSGELIWNGKRVKNVGFLHCVGSRQIEGVHPPQADGKVNDYCSRTCCTAILQQALNVKQRFPRVNVFDFHQDIRTYGALEDYYTRSSAAGIVFLRYHGDEPPVVEPGGNGSPLKVRLKDWLTFGEKVEVPLDLLVLGVGMVPHPIRDLIELMKLPVGADRFLQEVHPKLRPVEMAVNGVLLAGTCQAPMNIEETLSAAAAAASKAAILLSREVVELDPFVAKVDAAKCIGCDRCLPECAYTGALVKETAYMGGEPAHKVRVNPGLCVGCGACVAVCPTRALDLKGWTLDQFDAMVDGLVAAVPSAG